ncbi:hypothetical protein RB608_10225 [Nocardioides sp. LHD-245]|uniref:hypothetical protein n=1 Tax=Nocardioides sp. LHD-245 TaxID=3051387 RepID=UPI0027DED731|nr:hypothetical protein [Nocardioides sp. LHD-245]
MRRGDVRDLLDMTAGIDVREDDNAYWPFTGTAPMYTARDLSAIGTTASTSTSVRGPAPSS